MEKVNLLAAVCMLAVLPAVGGTADTYTGIKLNIKDGSTVNVKLTSDLKTSFNGSELVMSDKSMTVAVNVDELSGWTYHNETLGVADIIADCDFSREGRTLRFSGLPENSRVSVFTVGGGEIYSFSGSGFAEADLASAPAGIYIVSVNGRSFKIALSE